jgi:hypothetical protein
MKLISLALLLLLCGDLKVSAQQTKDTSGPQFIPIINGFYNLENLFDTINDPRTNDEEFLPNSPKKYNTNIYFRKLHNLASVLSQVGTDINPDGLAFFASSEVENDTVLTDLIHQKEFEGRRYKSIVTHGPDVRGINISLIYSEKYFTPGLIRSYNAGVGFPTRDILYIKGLLIDEPVHILVNHWPSRRGTGSGRNFIEETTYYRGLESSRPGTGTVVVSDNAITGRGTRVSDGHGQVVTWNAMGGNDDGEGNAVTRITAAESCRKIIDSILDAEPDAKIILMGDLNDNPDNTSVVVSLKAKANVEDVGKRDLFNPYINIYKQGYGTLAYNGKWNLFDQIMYSHSMLDQQKSSLFFYKSYIFYRDFLIEKDDERYNGYPKRTWSWDDFHNGYSDHLPVYNIILKKL